MSRGRDHDGDRDAAARAPTPAQSGTGDMEPEEFREHAHRVADVAADYLATLESRRVLPDVRPGDVRAELPATPPVDPEPTEAILDDYRRLIEPNVTHWQHPRFMAYFPSVASGPGILGEWLATTLNSNVMLWRNAPASTELEECVVSWLRQMLGLPDAFSGMLTDTASVSTLLSLVAARHRAPGLDARRDGLAGAPPLTMYASEQAHMSVEKAALVVGIGTGALRRIPCDDAYRMDVAALRRAIRADRDAGRVPFCVVGTLGTTVSTSVDPARAIGELCREEGLWYHLDAAYGAAMALAPEFRELLDGWETADSIVVNPHKWMFTPFDASLLLFRDPDAFRGAFSLRPDYLRTGEDDAATNFNEYGIQLGRRFRALKLWMMIRWFGTEGFARRIRTHVEWARRLAALVDAEPDWERTAPTPMATVCFRHRPEGVAGDALDMLNSHNAAIVDRVNADGRFYLSHATLDGRVTLRLSIGNPRQTWGHVEEAWALLRRTASNP